MRELIFMSLFCEKIAENMGYAENAFERIKEAVKNKCPIVIITIGRTTE